MNLGIDFGSTYTILSTYREDQQKLEAVEADKGKNNVNVPSIVSLRKDNIRYGTSAKKLTGKKNVRTFKAFKMLLMEKNQAFVKARHYDETYTPQWAAKTFLGEVIAEAQRQNGASSVENGQFCQGFRSCYRIAI